MISFKLFSPSKLNLTLDIMGRDAQSGKHFVNTILYRDDSLYDEIELQPIDEKVNRLFCDHPDVSKDESNTILRALKLLNVTGWEIRLKKNIPVFAGLGGGSSNAGAVLKHFGKQKGLGIHELEELACQIGADVPFFVQDENLAYCEGYGDQIVQTWNIAPLKIEYIDTGIKVSTAEAYASLDLSQCGMNSAKTEAFLSLLNNQLSTLNFELSSSLIHNDFETGFFEKHPEFKDKGHLCGSGGWMWRLK